MASTSSHIVGTSVTVRLDRVSDGDTIRIFPPSSSKAEAVRILNIDTEESYSASSKPVTAWGKAAKQFAQSFFADTETVTLEFPDHTPLAEALVKHRGNYGRLLVYVHKDGVDYAEVAIQKGYSPYFTKYGHARFVSHRARYIAAERYAQAHHIGIWDQATVNGSVVNNYPAKIAWWNMRAAVIDAYRTLRAFDASILNTRLDYAAICDLAARNKVATVFSEVRSYRVIRGGHSLVELGSLDRPFNVFLPETDEATSGGALALSLLRNRYIADGELSPRVGYCYMTGQLSLFRGNPQIVIDSPHAITDSPTARAVTPTVAPAPNAQPTDPADAMDHDVNVAPPPPAGDGTGNGGVGGASVADPDTAAPLPRMTLRIASLLPDPVGADSGHEIVVIKAIMRDGPVPLDTTGERDDAAPSATPAIRLEDWRVRDASGRKMKLKGSIGAGEMKKFVIPRGGMSLNNNGDDVYLVDPEGRIVDSAHYTAVDVVEGVMIHFPM